MVKEKVKLFGQFPMQIMWFQCDKLIMNAIFFMNIISDDSGFCIVSRPTMPSGVQRVLPWTVRQQTHEPEIQSQNSNNFTLLHLLDEIEMLWKDKCISFSDKEWKILAVSLTIKALAIICIYDFISVNPFVFLLPFSPILHHTHAFVVSLSKPCPLMRHYLFKWLSRSIPWKAKTVGIKWTKRTFDLLRKKTIEATEY